MVPHPPPAKPSIRYRYTKVSAGSYEYESTFNREAEQWSVKRARPAIPGMVLYAQVDGGFSVWDESPWRRRGDANNWLTSALFDLREPRSLEAERAMERARDLLRRKDSASVDEIEQVDEELRRSLGDVDPFWVRWSAFVERVRGTS